MSEPIIIEIPSPTCRARFVLVHVGQCSGTTCGIPRDATPADLLRAGYVPREVPSAEAWKAAHAEAERELIRARAALAEQPDPGTLAHLRADLRDAVKRAEKAERERDEARARADNMIDVASERANTIDVLRTELAEASKALLEAGCGSALPLAGRVALLVDERAGLRAGMREAKELARVLEVERDEAKAGHNAVQPRVYALEAELADAKAECRGAMLSAHTQYAETVRERDASREECSAQIARAVKAERERDHGREELARLTAPGEGEPTDVLRGLAYRPNTEHEEDALDAYRLGVAHERARQQPAKDLREVSAELEAMRTTHDERDRVYVGAIASDDELVTVYRRAAEPLGDEHGVSLRDLVRRCQARGVLAVAARVRQERCLVAQAVAAGADIHVTEVFGNRWRVVVTDRDANSKRDPCLAAADVPAALARLLGEVSRG